MKSVLDFFKENFLQLINLLVLTVFGASGWKLVSTWKKNIELIHKSEISKRDFQIEQLKSEIDKLRQESIPEVHKTIDAYRNYTLNVQELLDRTTLENEEKDKIIKELNENFEAVQSHVNELKTSFDTIRRASIIGVALPTGEFNRHIVEIEKRLISDAGMLAR